ncbi:LGFP repeat-containing protein [Litorihabitans aurantiacus]|uniref:LGFP repeat-containing protein n=1 Tax=Litorihabitans aurantiacus TaxID=1930061 RepID=A0AA37XEH9_9MICO|nr:hypothetical protein [Litorihabitans aurantiacus]GMA31562.1 hypothetical protein GCM10025875_15540 [Litorihabitans aurantiacus]
MTVRSKLSALWAVATALTVVATPAASAQPAPPVVAPAPAWSTDAPGWSWQRTADGVVYDSPRGQFVVPSRTDGGRSINDEHLAHGGGRGALGYPIDTVRADVRDPFLGERTYQRFERGIVYAGPLTATTFNSSAIARFHQANGGGGGWLGYPWKGEIREGYQHWYQEFATGYVYSSPAGTYATHGSVQSLHNSLGGGGGPIGYPTGRDTVQGHDYRFQTFERAIIYCLPSAYPDVPQCSAVSGAIRDAHNANGGGTGSLGYPKQDQAYVGNGTWWQLFERGSIYVSATGVTITR